MPATAFVLAAGLGTRLRPLTLTTPKPLLPVHNLPMLDHVLRHARRFGHDEVVVNAYWLADQIVAWAADKPGVHVVVEAPTLLGTGGGLQNARALLSERFVVLNGDILCDVDLAALWAMPGPAAMAVRRQAGSEFTPVTVERGRVTGIQGVVGPEGGGHHFTGVHVLNREVLDLVPDGAACVVRTVYRTLIPRGEVGALEHDGRWLDIGTLGDYQRANDADGAWPPL